MFKKKNKIIPECKAKEMERSKENDNLAKFFKTRIRVETDTRIYITNFYSPPVKENKCCNIL